jgi:hypothetical protein
MYFYSKISNTTRSIDGTGQIQGLIDRSREKGGRRGERLAHAGTVPGRRVLCVPHMGPPPVRMQKAEGFRHIQVGGGGLHTPTDCLPASTAFSLASRPSIDTLDGFSAHAGSNNLVDRIEQSERSSASLSSSLKVRRKGKKNTNLGIQDLSARNQTSDHPWFCCLFGFCGVVFYVPASFCFA